MTADKPKTELKEYAGGWITERKDPEIPGFLKLAYPIIVIAAFAYLFLYMNGEITHSTRGNLVQQLNAVTGTANGFMYIVAAMILAFTVILLAFVFGKQSHKD